MTEPVGDVHHHPEPVQEGEPGAPVVVSSLTGEAAGPSPLL